ncbi:OB-fold nucleic acid binding domain-containing protein [Gilvimarinus sp. F26214L]|uniref:OB-fold nucleic acid binding domain-containing protein n=1 Tax=Gilvimarinus sp. DZF01 TaxID=3461371 RepID=UPI0040457082
MTIRSKAPFFASLATTAALLAALPVLAQQPDQDAGARSDQQTEQSEPNPRMPSDQPLDRFESEASITLKGTVAEVGQQQFTLDYGKEQITVSLADWSWSDDQLREHLKQGQEVTVSGTVDDSLFERRQIEADNIYVDAEYAYYYLVDENPAYAAGNGSGSSSGTFLSTRGQVKEVGDGEITLESEGSTIQVDLSELGYDPLDEEGTQVRQGDQVYVFGDIDENFYETRTLSAESLVTLSEAGQVREQEEGIDLPQFEPDRPDVQEPVRQQPPQAGPSQDQPPEQ